MRFRTASLRSQPHRATQTPALKKLSSPPGKMTNFPRGRKFRLDLRRETAGNAGAVWQRCGLMDRDGRCRAGGTFLRGTSKTSQNGHNPFLPLSLAQFAPVTTDATTRRDCTFWVGIHRVGYGRGRVTGVLGDTECGQRGLIAVCSVLASCSHRFTFD